MAILFRLAAIVLFAAVLPVPAASAGGGRIPHIPTRPQVAPPVTAPRAAPPVPGVLMRALKNEAGALDSHVAAGGSGLAARLRALIAPFVSRGQRATPGLAAWAPAIARLAGGGPDHAIVARALVQDVYERLGVHPDWSAVGRAVPMPSKRTTFRRDYPGAVAVPSPNFWKRPRHGSRKILYVVIHDTESSCASALNTLINPRADASAHFLVCRDGRIYQLVNVADSAWHAGNAYVNLHSIGIEHEGYAGGPYTEQQYRATAGILRWVRAHDHLDIQWTRNAVFGHENVPAADHTDPGLGWNWPYFMSLLRGGKAYPGGNKDLAVVTWPQVYVHSCASIHCSVEGTANSGEQFHVRGRATGWLQIDFSGTRGWILSGATGSGSGTLVRPRGKHSLTVYSAPGKYGAPIGRVAVGQAYASTLVDDSTDRRGWWLIEYAHRYGYVCACLTTPGFTPTPTPTPSGTVTATVTATPTPWWVTGTATPTATPWWVTATPTATPWWITATPTPTPTPKPRPMRRATPTPTPYPIIILTPTPTPSATSTPIPSPSPTSTATATATPLPYDTTTPLPDASPSPPPFATPTPDASSWPN